MKKVFILLLSLSMFAEGVILPEIEWDLPSTWRVVNLERTESPYVLLVDKKTKVLVFRYEWKEDLLWSITKSWRNSLQLPILTEEELLGHLEELPNGVRVCSFLGKGSLITGGFLKMDSSLWVFKFALPDEENGDFGFKDFLKTVHRGKALAKYVENLKFKVEAVSVDAQLEYAQLLLEGRGVDYDHEKAMVLLNKARQAGSTEACFRLALLAQKKGYLNDCFTLLEEGAARKHLGCLKKLSGLLLEFKKDYSAALVYLTSAAELGDAEAMHFLGNLYAKNSKLLNEKKAFKWIEMAALKEYGPSLYTLATFYRSGFGGEANKLTAVGLLEKAALKKDSRAFELLGDMYRGDELGDKNSQKALAYYVKSAVEGSSSSLVKIADMYLAGDGIPKNTTEGLKLLRESARRTYTPAMNRLGDLLTRGIEVKADFEGAYSWYLKSAQAGDPAGMFGVSLALFAGKGVIKDQFEAVKWMKVAAAKGHKMAQKMLKDTGF
jgi:TPR repeat protein